ncbi:MAG TPA: dehydrogenase [Verrucomicrobiales bacterium]|nr:dehydrogenase [Verrucomicrobiales bacterium]
MSQQHNSWASLGSAIVILGAGLSSSAAEVRHQIGPHGFSLPDGYRIELISGPELTQRPIHADIDEHGRLYVAESSGSNDAVQKQLEEKPHSILRLVDTDGDGRFDSRTVFADQLMFPEGVLWHEGSVYVTAPPAIWKFTDTDDDGVADRREEWYNPGTLTGCANDLHGPFLGRDGWIYWCKGAFAEQKHPLVGGGEFVSRAAHIFRRHPRGGGVEVVMTGGMDNPVEFTMNEAGDRFFTSTFMLHPGGGRRDGIGHAGYGAVFGKPNNVLDDHPRTRPELNGPATHLGAAAPSGLCLLESAQLGEGFRGNLFSAAFNLRTVFRHRLLREAAGYRSIDEPFLVGESRDFHPTDVFEDADGSLIVIDTGGWYKLCCPTSQLYKPDVLGGIYRISRIGAHQVDDPRGLRLAWDETTEFDLAQRLEDERPAVRQRAVTILAGRGPRAIAACAAVLRRSAHEHARTAAVWVLSRVDDPGARALAAIALLDTSETVRQAALYSMALWRDVDAVPQLISVLRDPSAAIRRTAAEALGRIGDSSAIPALIEGLGEDDNTDQPLIRALIDIGNSAAIREAVATAAPMPLGVIVALDQLGALQPQELMPLFSRGKQERHYAGWIVRRHPEWGGALTEFFSLQLSGLKSDPDFELAALIGSLAADRGMQDWITVQLNQAGSNDAARITLLNAMGRTALKSVPGGWKTGLAKLLSSAPSESVLHQAVQSIGRFDLKAEQDQELRSALLSMVRNAGLKNELRIEALMVAPAPFADGDGSELFLLGLRGLESDQPESVRSISVRAIARQPLSAAHRELLLPRIAGLRPMELNQILGALAEPAAEEIDARVIEAIAKAQSFRALPVDRLRSTFAKYPDRLKSEVEKLMVMLDEGFAEKQARLDNLLAGLKEGDVRRGQEVFNSPRAACSACHAIGYQGGQLGPDLTTIGQIRSERDLLEAIVYPSASFVRSYEPVRVRLQEDQEHSGILKREDTDFIELAAGPETVTRIARADIVDMEPGTVSVMPGGLEEQLSRQELADLLAFLKATRWR